jgi:ribosomal protein L11 methyltransferase
MTGVDWNEQWSLFAKNFHDGKAHIPIKNKTLLLLPGPGFGDLSHPTTALMLKMMEKVIKKEAVIDIGTGCGILALASLLLGAKQAIGIDIDPEALKHARRNSKLNRLKASFRKTLPKTLGDKHILLMNMILSEQREIKPEELNHFAKLWITSGILENQKGAYLAQASSWGWQPLSIHRKKGWLGFIFRMKLHHSHPTKVTHAAHSHAG